MESPAPHDLDEPCSSCDEPATGLLGTRAFCAGCREAVLAPIRARVIARQGTVDVIRRDGQARFVRWRPDHGPGMADLACDCDAGWVGPPTEVECPWCAERVAWARLRAHDDALRAPESDEPAAVVHWARELRHAVTEGVVSEAEARRAIGNLAVR